MTANTKKENQLTKLNIMNAFDDPSFDDIDPVDNADDDSLDKAHEEDLAEVDNEEIE